MAPTENEITVPIKIEPKPEHPLIPWARWAALVLIGIVTAWLTSGKIPSPPPPVAPLNSSPPFVILMTTGTNGGSCQCLDATKKP